MARHAGPAPRRAGHPGDSSLSGVLGVVSAQEPVKAGWWLLRDQHLLQVPRRGISNVTALPGHRRCLRSSAPEPDDVEQPGRRQRCSAWTRHSSRPVRDGRARLRPILRSLRPLMMGCGGESAGRAGQACVARAVTSTERWRAAIPGIMVTPCVYRSTVPVARKTSAVPSAVMSVTVSSRAPAVLHGEHAVDRPGAAAALDPGGSGTQWPGGGRRRGTAGTAPGDRE